MSVSQALERIESTPEFQEVKNILYYSRKGGEDQHWAWVNEAPKGEVVNWAAKIQARRDKDLGQVPEHLKYLYERIDPYKGEESPYDWAEMFLYAGDKKQVKKMRPSPPKYRVAKVTDRFVYAIIREDEYRTVRLDRAELENGEGVAANSLSTFCGFFYTWDAIKAECEEFSAKWDAWVNRTSERIAQEMAQVEANGFKCAKCGRICDDGLRPADWQRDNHLAMVGWAFKTPYDGQAVCKSCHQMIFDEYWPK